MAEDKKSFILYADLIFTVRKLSDENAGKLFKHILAYVNDENPTPENDYVDLSFEPIKQQLKRDLAKWEKFREKQSENGKRGGRPKKPNESEPSNENPKNPSLLNESQKSLNVTDNVTVTVNDSVINTTGYIRPKDFLESYNAIELDNLKCSTGLDEEKINLCIEQWSLSIEGSDFKYTNDKKEDYRKLIARLKKWINTWSANDAAKPPPKQTGKVNTKPTAEDYLRILTIAQNGNNAENNTD